MRSWKATWRGSDGKTYETSGIETVRRNLTYGHSDWIKPPPDDVLKACNQTVKAVA